MNWLNDLSWLMNQAWFRLAILLSNLVSSQNKPSCWQAWFSLQFEWWIQENKLPIMNRLILLWIVGILLVVETLAKSKCKKKPCSNTNGGYGTGHGYNGDTSEATPEQKKKMLIFFSVGASISLIVGIIFCVWSKCCGLCKKKTPLQPIEE